MVKEHYKLDIHTEYVSLNPIDEEEANNLNKTN